MYEDKTDFNHQSVLMLIRSEIKQSEIKPATITWGRKFKLSSSEHILLRISHKSQSVKQYLVPKRLITMPIPRKHATQTSLSPLATFLVFSFICFWLFLRLFVTTIFGWTSREIKAYIKLHDREGIGKVYSIILWAIPFGNICCRKNTRFVFVWCPPEISIISRLSHRIQSRFVVLPWIHTENLIEFGCHWQWGQSAIYGSE